MMKTFGLKRFCFLAAALSCCVAVLGIAQEEKSSPCIVEDLDIPRMPKCVIHARHGSLVIPKRYWIHPEFNEYGLAAFTIESFGRVYINRAGRIVIRDVAFMDNFPDEFHHGLVRIERDGNWGYADPNGRIVVPIKYSCALNYKDQYTDIGPLVCIGCRSQQQGEYNACVGGQWFLTDVHGNLKPVAPPN